MVGSGAAGLAAALAAAARGADVTVVERALALGGTTAYSAGTAWMPGHHLLGGSGNDVHAALEYLTDFVAGDAEPNLMRTFVEDAPRVSQALERESPLRWRALPYPDYHVERRGAARGERSLEPQPLAADKRLRDLVRGVPFVRTPSPVGASPEDATADGILARRASEGGPNVLNGGRALVGALWTGASARGAVLRAGTRADGLLTKGHEVVGVKSGAGEVRGQVVLATGGFERNRRFASEFLGDPRPVPLGAPECEGDGLKLAMALGARLGNMSEAWWCPAFRVPGETFQGTEVFRISVTERARPGSLVVDCAGRRFTDETQDYSSLGRTMRAFDAGSAGYPRSPALLIFDSGYRRTYNLGPIVPSDADPSWLTRGDDIGELARRIGVPVAAFEETVTRFNAGAESGVDDDFGRGVRAYGRFMAGALAPYQTLAPLREPPYFALSLVCGCLGTNGGLRTDARGCVLRVTDDRPLPGLYAAGNAAASPFGAVYPGAGGTIGPALVLGYRAGAAAAGQLDPRE